MAASGTEEAFTDKADISQSTITLHGKTDLKRLLRDKFHYGDNRSLHLHFLDVDYSPDLRTTETDSSQEKSKPSVLSKDIDLLSKFTDGVFVTWSGHKYRQPGPKEKSLLHQTFYKLFDEDDFKNKRSLVVALPSGNVDSPDKVPAPISVKSHHTLLTESAVGGVTQVLRQTLISSADNAEVTPVVCVLVNGGKESIKTAVFAVRAGIPLILMKGSGGFADVLADLHEEATLEPRRVRDNGRVKTIAARVPADEKLEEVKKALKDDEDLTSDVMELCNSLHLMTVYYPCDNNQHKLVSIIPEALIRNGQDDQITVLLQTMKLKKKEIDMAEQKECFIADNAKAMELFIDSLLMQSPTAVSAFLTHWGIDFNYFNLDSLLRLYSKEVRFKRNKDEHDDRQLGHYQRFLQSRRDLKAYVKRVSTNFPLRCSGAKCQQCTHRDKVPEDNNELTPYGQTCLHPVQEIFLWSLISGNMDLAQAVWVHCDDKMATALFGRAVCLGICSTESKGDTRRELSEYASRFESLAVQTLKAIEVMDEEQTGELLDKPCPWWGDVTAIGMAMITKSKLFISQDACRQLLDVDWSAKGRQWSKKCLYFKDTQATGQDKTKETCIQMRPRPKYYLSLVRMLVYQIVFLCLFGYTLLFELSPSSTAVWTNPCLIAVVVWVLDTAGEEIRQATTYNSRVEHTRATFRNKVEGYLSHYWNKLDSISIALFLLGCILLLVPSDSTAFLVGRGLLAFDYIVFVMRFLQMLVIHKELGVFLVMAGKMLMDSLRFMGIVMTILAGYAVAVESLLHPELSFTWKRLLSLPARSYWQSFGELGLDDLTEPCDGASEKCASAWALYVVTVMFGVYMVVNHVLLFNLLIAKFSSTYEAVMQTADQHQAWQFCQLVTEFQTRSPLPPPFNIVRCLVSLCRALVSSCRKVSSTGTHPAQQNFLSKCDVEEWCGKCVTVQKKQENRPVKVKVTHLNTLNIKIESYTFTLGESHERLFLWKDRPFTTMNVKVNNQDVPELGRSDEQKRRFRNNWKLHTFELQQAMHVLKTEAHAMGQSK